MLNGVHLPSSKSVSEQRAGPAATSAVLDNTEKPSQQSLLAYVKKKADGGAVRKIVTVMEETEAGTGLWGTVGLRPDAGIYRTSIRSLLNTGRTDLAVDVYRMRMTAREQRPNAITVDFPLAASVIRAVLRDSKKRKMRALDSQAVFEEMKMDCEISRDMNSCGGHEGGKNISKKVGALISVMNAFLADGDIRRVEEALRAIGQLPVHSTDAALPVKEYNNAIRFLGKSRLLTGVFTILDLMRASEVEPNNETFEFLANAAVRQVDFVTGAVSMDTLPDPLGTEVAFVGRSNVGKSSLVNMICNRKALAYVSGRPGKTQQFNYFLVNGKDTDSQFYMVDLPGVGYAKVPRPVQDAWTNFMRQYLKHRTSLRLVFHLIDGRHGALVDDEALMRQMSASGRHNNEYVIVLTKMDKMDKQKVKQSILDKTKAALSRNGCRRDTSIVLTSSTTRLGRDEMWRHLQSALAPVSATLSAARSSQK